MVLLEIFLWCGIQLSEETDLLSSHLQMVIVCFILREKCKDRYK
jgi:hypothetical protein